MEWVQVPHLRSESTAAVVPSVVVGGQRPKVAVGITHDPLLLRTVDVEGEFPYCEHESILERTLERGKVLF